ncbi:hypothetical protein HYH03_017717 [Edaphochlamys debaryana]|uniref:VCBS repeat-containing protein n=1 Tax=Edaphochlamys debaryana TaxID=47281 RepID=A0A835XNN4_9CHLO|nr:hypothetical protein HYH03_017717 [Edaphochlamys debaryana]|eukprot:KAG2483409.1 hypothetical protein HYH03_017717 [Edaphochlamys debaryana]
MPSRRHRPGLGLRVSCAAAVALVVCIAAAPLGALAQLSTAVAHDKQLKEVSGDNKYRDRKADLDKEGDIQHEGPVPGAQHCGKHRLDLGWMTEATSSVYATPLITDLHADGRRDIIVPSFVHYLEVLEGPNGGQAVGWPAFHSSSVHASPLLYDVDFDGVRDVLLATYDGQILFYKDTGDKMREGIQISRLRVRKDWYVGLDPTDPFDHTHPDAHADLGKPLTRAAKGDRDAQAKTPTGGSGGTNSMTERVRKFVKQISEYRAKYGDTAADKLMAEARLTNAVFYDAVMAMVAEQKKADGGASGSSGASGSRRRLMSMDEGESEGGAASGIGLGGGRGAGARRRLMQAEGGATTTTTTTTTTNPDGSKTTTVVSTDPASGVTTTETTTVKPDGTTTSTSRSAVPEGTATVEAGPGGATQISKEAAESFDIFEVQEVDTATAVGGGGGVDPQLDGEGLALGEGEGIDAATQAEFEAAQAAFEAERARLEAAGLTNPDGDVTAEQLAAAGEGLGSDVDLDMFLSRLQYDEFGDLDATAEILAGSADEHEHGIDLNAADPDAFDSDHYKHLYLGDYVGGNGRGFRGWLDEDFHQLIGIGRDGS